MLNFTEAQKNELLILVSEYKKTKQKSLWPIFDELCASLDKGILLDAYQARYLRDAFSSTAENKEKYVEYDNMLVEKYFPSMK